jgi:hypothetical protein
MRGRYYFIESVSCVTRRLLRRSGTLFASVCRSFYRVSASHFDGVLLLFSFVSNCDRIRCSGDKLDFIVCYCF